MRVRGGGLFVCVGGWVGARFVQESAVKCTNMCVRVRERVHAGGRGGRGEGRGMRLCTDGPRIGSVRHAPAARGPRKSLLARDPPTCAPNARVKSGVGQWEVFRARECRTWRLLLSVEVGADKRCHCRDVIPEQVRGYT